MSLPLLRPATLDDLPALIRFADQAAYGITSLPRDARRLQQKIERSLSSFQEKIDRVTNQTYLFCLEWEGEVVGTSAIISRIGLDEPFYIYHIIEEPLHSPTLNIDRKTPVLHLVQAHKKPTEIGTLFLAPGLRKKHLGKFLSLTRFLFIASFRERFASTIIAELRGINYNGISPFWDRVGRPFFGIDFPEADLLRSRHYQTIRELFPKHPLYIELLPPNAQEVIGHPHPDTLGAQKILLKQGFRQTRYVDLFDSGPHLYAPTAEIDAIASSATIPIAALQPTPNGQLAILTNNRLDFRATFATLQITPNGAILSPEVAHTLRLSTGDTLRYYSFT